MFVHNLFIRVSYADTDQMGIVHHSRYVLYCETARSEAIRELGITYKQIETGGIFMPVISLKMEYLKPAYYDELLTVKTILREMPKTRMIFENEFYNVEGTLLNKAAVTLTFVNKETGKLSAPPDFLIESLQKYFIQ